MTLLGDRVPPGPDADGSGAGRATGSEPSGAGGHSWADRLLQPWPATRRRWWGHTFALAAVLTAVFLYVGPNRVMTADEGAALAQARVLQTTGSWSMPQDVRLDPHGRWDPIHLSDRVGDRRFLFVRNPPYALLIAWADGLGGVALATGLSSVALLIAALGAGRLAEFVRAGRGIQAMWLTGVLTPLLFDGSWVLAHTIVAAGAAWATLAAVRFVAGGSRWWSVLTVCALGVSASMRSEGVLFALALAGGAGALLVGRRVWREGSWQRPVAVMSSATLVAAVAYKGLRLWTTAIEGGRQLALYHPGYDGGWLRGRVGSLGLTLLATTEDGGSRLAQTLTLASAAAVVAAIVAARSGRFEPRVVRALSSVGVAAAAARLALPAGLVPGLIVAAPMMIAAALVLPRREFADRSIRMIAVAAAGLAVLVALTQSTVGGVGEWGGRYFHVALPLVVVIAVVSLDSLLADRPALARMAIPGAVAAGLLVSVLAVQTQRVERLQAGRVVDTAWKMASRARTASGVAGSDGAVIVSSWIPAGRFSWSHVLEARYLTVPDPGDLDDVGRSLRAAGVRRFTFIGVPGRRPTLSRLPAGFEVGRVVDLPDGWFVAEIHDGGA